MNKANQVLKHKISSCPCEKNIQSLKLSKSGEKMINKRKMVVNSEPVKAL